MDQMTNSLTDELTHSMSELNRLHNDVKQLYTVMEKSIATMAINRKDVLTDIKPVNNTKTKLYEFMEQFRNTDSSSKCTHIMYDAYKTYIIPDDRYEKFIQLYTHALMSGADLAIIEKSKEFGHLHIDIDFKQSDSTRYYTHDIVNNIVEIYNQAIRTYLDVSDNDMECFLLEKEKPNYISNRLSLFKDGIHIIYPHLCIDSDIEMKIKIDARDLIKKNHVIKNIPHINDLESVFHPVRCDYFMYGSGKPDNVYLVKNGLSLTKYFVNLFCDRRYKNACDATPLIPIPIPIPTNSIKMAMTMTTINPEKSELQSLLDQISFLYDDAITYSGWASQLHKFNNNYVCTTLFGNEYWIDKTIPTHNILTYEQVMETIITSFITNYKTITSKINVLISTVPHPSNIQEIFKIIIRTTKNLDMITLSQNRKSIGQEYRKLCIYTKDNN